MLTITLKGTAYKIKTDWQDVSLADYIRWENAKLWRSRFIALNDGAADVWDSDPDFGLASMSFMGEDPIDNHLNPFGEGLPTVDASEVWKYWHSLVDIADGEKVGLSTLELGAKIYTNYMSKTEDEWRKKNIYVPIHYYKPLNEQQVLAMPILEVYGAIAFFLRILAVFRKGSQGLANQTPTTPIRAYSSKRV